MEQLMCLAGIREGLEPWMKYSVTHENGLVGKRFQINPPVRAIGCGTIVDKRPCSPPIAFARRVDKPVYSIIGVRLEGVYPTSVNQGCSSRRTVQRSASSVLILEL